MFPVYFPYSGLNDTEPECFMTDVRPCTFLSSSCVAPRINSCTDGSFSIVERILSVSGIVGETSLSPLNDDSLEMIQGGTSLLDEFSQYTFGYGGESNGLYA